VIVDPLNNAQMSVNFQPLYEAMHIYGSLNKAEELRRTYDADRRKQMDLLLPSHIALDESGTQLHNLLADITGFAILERATAARTQEFRSVSEIEGLWDLMCAQVIDLMTDAVAKINNPKVLLTVKESVTLFMQTIKVSHNVRNILTLSRDTIFQWYGSRNMSWLSSDPTPMFSNGDLARNLTRYSLYAES